VWPVSPAAECDAGDQDAEEGHAGGHVVRHGQALGEFSPQRVASRDVLDEVIDTASDPSRRTTTHLEDHRPQAL
jgi:hypothetical protein